MHVQEAPAHILKELRHWRKLHLYEQLNYFLFFYLLVLYGWKIIMYTMQSMTVPVLLAILIGGFLLWGVLLYKYWAYVLLILVSLFSGPLIPFTGRNGIFYLALFALTVAVLVLRQRTMKKTVEMVKK